MLSNYCRNIANDCGIKIGNVNKLVSNLSTKSKHVLHYKNLQFFLSLGIKVTKVNRILKFKQLDWLKTYIDFNTYKRKNAANNSENYFLKYMNNSVYGKTMKNNR